MCLTVADVVMCDVASDAYVLFEMFSDKVIETKSKNEKFIEGRNSKTRINKISN